MSDQPMRIFDLEVTDLKRIEFAHITPTGAVVEIAGKNGNGKTSIMDAIWWALDGKDAITSEPVRKGAEKATIKLDLGDLIVKRTIKPDRSGTISVSNKEGMTAKSPQQLLDKLVGELTFDPLSFIRKTPAEQMDMLRSFAPDTNFRELDRNEEAAAQARRDLNRDVKALEAVVSAHGQADAALPEGVDVSALTEELAAIQKHNAAVTAAAAQHQADARVINEREANLANLYQRRERLRADLARLDQDHKDLEAELATMKVAHQAPDRDFRDEAGITTQLREAQTKNEARARAVALAERAAADRKTLEQKRKMAATADEAVTAIREKRATALKAINLPIDGLTIGAAGIMLNDHPLEQASDAEQLRVGIALAMKANPKLRVVRIRDGSLLDDDSMVMLRETAERENFQVWIERVGTGGENAVVIEAGRVKGAKVAEEPQAAE